MVPIKSVMIDLQLKVLTTLIEYCINAIFVKVLNIKIIIVGSFIGIEFTVQKLNSAN